MTYACIKCRTLWQVGLPSEEVSGGLCKECFIEYIRDRQRRQGFHDCFGRATERCSRVGCNYHEICCKGLSS